MLSYAVIKCCEQLFAELKGTFICIRDKNVVRKYFYYRFELFFASHQFFFIYIFCRIFHVLKSDCTEILSWKTLPNRLGCCQNMKENKTFIVFHEM